MKSLTGAAMLLIMGQLGACNTVSGAGEDIQATGDKVEEIAEETREKIDD